MKISFVIPAHNEEKYIGPCLESFLRQIKGRFGDFEIIVVNNASSDRTGEVARGFAGVKVIDEPRKGLSQARQTGFEAASGQLIANMDADNRLPDGWISTVLSAFEKDPKLVGLSGPKYFYDVSVFTRLLIGIYYWFAYLTYLINSKIFGRGSLVEGGNYVARKDALLAIGGYNADFKFYGEDVDVARRLFKVGKIIYSFRLVMHTSGRRLNAEGLWKMGFVYPMNYFWTMLFGKPFSKRYTNIR